MSRPRTSVAIFVAVLGLCAAIQAPVATAGWMVNGTEFTGTKALARTAKVVESFRFEAAGTAVVCSGSTFDTVQAEIIAPNKGAAASIELHECKPEGKECTISNSTIASVPVVAEATLEGTKGSVTVITPKTKATFATVFFEGTMCALNGTVGVTGKATVKFANGQIESTQQLGVLATTKGEMKVGSSEVVGTGEFTRRLAGGERWSFL